MKILGIDSSGMTATVAVLEDDKLLAEYTINHKKTHSQTLVPMLDEIKKMTELDLDSLDAIAIAAGPGSFTGLRIGSATAKGLGLALDKPLVPVSTLEGLAMNAWGYDGLVCPIMDARRDQVYTGVFRFVNGKLERVMEDTAESVTDLIGQLEGFNEKVLFLGDGVPVFKETIDSSLKVSHEYAPAHMSRQRAGALAALAAVYLEQGKTESAADHRPEYLRPSQAERVKAERECDQK
ncbi:MAG: tRNA (adenosine(37)-N6)-threonylcarbamoyltransferase complex dimerization subunit type 1 TsaB [Lachnospiraceae bacterium]|nr:tRNA (adenosine(37)-N6)-threonylcarbamoyltransferase complex dimerization subunit type 1 TsaB [Lachnospiraceae bacterium]